MTATPECDKVHKVHEESQSIGAFLEWLSGQGVVLCRWATPRESRRCTGVLKNYFLDLDNCKGTGVALRTVMSDADWSLPRAERPDRTIIIAAGDECTKCGGTGSFEYDGAEQYMPDYMAIEKRLAAYFDIDLNKVEQERRAVLDEARSAS